MRERTYGDSTVLCTNTQTPSHPQQVNQLLATTHSLPVIPERASFSPPRGLPTGSPPTSPSCTLRTPAAGLGGLRLELPRP